MKKFDNRYWSTDKILSRNKLFNFVLGNRGGGKSFAAKRHVINRFLKQGEQFVYVRRNRNEFDFIKTYFNDISDFFPGHTFEVKAGQFLIDSKTAGYYIPLSVSTKYKSSSYPLVTYIIFDEFLIDKGRISYLKNEVELFLDLYETIARTRDVRVLFLSNTLSTVNPYFLYFKININPGVNFITLDEIAVEIVKGKEYTEMKRQTRFGKMISNTVYGDYAIEGSFYLDDDRFISKMTGKCTPFFGISYNGEIFSLYLESSTGYIHVTSKGIAPGIPVYCFFNQDHEPNLIFIERALSNPQIAQIKRIYDYGMVRFESQKARSMFLECMSLL